MDFSWLKDLSPAALMCVALIYVVRTLGPRLDAMSQCIRDLCVVIGTMKGEFNGFIAGKGHR